MIRTLLLCLTLFLLGALAAKAQPDTLTVGGEVLYFNTDWLLHLIVTEGYTPEVQNLNVHYFVDIVDRMPYERQLKLVVISKFKIINFWQSKIITTLFFLWFIILV